MRGTAGGPGRVRAAWPWRVAAVALLAAALAWLPRAAQADLWSAELAAAYGLGAEFEQLRAIRERTARREALRRDLRRTVGELSREVVALQRRGEQASAEIARQDDALRAHELALDRVFPRLLARLRAIDQRRAQAARALADLAGLSRRRELDPELRVRLRAVGPVLLAVVRNAEAAGAALAAQRDRLVEHRQRLETRLANLHAEIAWLEGERARMQEQRGGALQELVGLDAELRRLARAGAALARPLLVAETARRARVEPDAARPAQDRAGTVLVVNTVRGEAGPPGGMAALSRASVARRTTAAAVVPAPELRRLHLVPTLAVRQPLPGAARVRAGRHQRAVAAGPVRDGMDSPVSSAISLASLSSRVTPAQLPRPAPIRPTRAVAAGPHGDGQVTGVTIGAIPGQRVAAPQDGRVVFADVFKGYGLLLIIEHDREYHTLLWGFSKVRVAVGDEVRGGEVVGVMDLIDGVPPRLGVELRRRGRPVDPLPWVAGSSSKVRG